MVGTVYLKTDRFEVKLEGITSKIRDFESIRVIDFLTNGKMWSKPPIVGLDVIRHPRDPSIALLILCFGVGCVILKFYLKEQLPGSILNFLRDDRIIFVGFGVLEKKDLFPFYELGLRESKVDVGYLAAKVLDDPSLKKCELAELANEVLGIKQMVGLTEKQPLSRHTQIKCAICEVFISTMIAMKLLDQNNEIMLEDSPKKSLCGKNLDPPSFLHEQWSKMFKSNKENTKCKNKQGKYHRSGKVAPSPENKPLKGILKSSHSTTDSERGPNLERANSKGCNVSFLIHDTMR